MRCSLRRSALPRALAFVTAFAPFAVVTHAAAPPEQARITAVANVTLRATPSSTATAVARLPLGTELIVVPVGLDKTWLRVRLADERHGWVQASLTEPLDPAWRWTAFDAIIASRLGRKGDMFPAQVELVSFIERVAPEYTNPDGRAGVELARLRALSLAAGAIPFNQSRREPYAAWLASRSVDLVYDEPGGRWMVRDTAIWNVHQKHAASSVADDIAWFGVTNGLSGECEGHIACYLYAQNQLQGEYLRRHPAGRHAAEAVDTVVTSIDDFAPGGKVQPSFYFDRTKDCAELTKAVAGLTAAVQRSKAGARDRALSQLAALRSSCG